MSSLYPRGKYIWYEGKDRLGNRVQRSTRETDMSGAKLAQLRIDLELLGKVDPSSSSISCQAAKEDFLASLKHRCTPEYIQDSSKRISDFILFSKIGSVSDIRERDVQVFLTHVLDTPRIIRKGRKNEEKRYPSRHHANNAFAAIKIWLNFCVKQSYIDKNPILHMKKYKIDETTRRSLTSEEQTKIKAEAMKEDIYPAVMTCYYTGMRKREILHLEWEDIDFERNLIDVKNKKGKFRTKSRKNRPLLLHPELKTILIPLRKKEGYCFDRTNIRRVFDRVLRNAGIDVKNVKWHLFRHTAASTMIDRGASLSAVKDVLGHADIATTAKYTHTLPNATKEAMNLL